MVTAGATQALSIDTFLREDRDNPLQVANMRLALQDIGNVETRIHQAASLIYQLNDLAGNSPALPFLGNRQPSPIAISQAIDSIKSQMINDIEQQPQLCLNKLRRFDSSNQNIRHLCKLAEKHLEKQRRAQPPEFNRTNIRNRILAAFDPSKMTASAATVIATAAVSGWTGGVVATAGVVGANIAYSYFESKNWYREASA